MNKITFAGKIPGFDGMGLNKCYEIILPAQNGKPAKLLTDYLERGYGYGDVILIPPNCKYMLIDPNPKDLHVFLEQATIALKVPEIMRDVENEGIRRAAEQAETFLSSAWNNKDIVIAALGNLIVSYIGLYAGETKKLSPVTRQVLNEIERHVSDPTFSLENFIKSLPLNYDYIRKLFKSEIGATPHEHLTSTKMELAASLIAYRMANQYSEYSVSQLAEACGYTDSLYFSRVFKKHFGVSPSEFKNRPVT